MKNWLNCIYFIFSFINRLNNLLYFIFHVMLILINQYLLSVIFSMTKASNGQNSCMQNFYSLTFQCYLETLLLIILVCLFSSPSSLFIFKLHKISPDLTPVVISCFPSSTNIMDSKLIEINQMKILIYWQKL